MRPLFAFLLCASSAFAQSIVTSGGGRSIVLSGRGSVAIVQPSVPSEVDTLKAEIDFLKSSLAAATEKPVEKPVTPPVVSQEMPYTDAEMRNYLAIQ